MITLTTPPTVISVLGGTTTVAYNKLVLTPITFEPLTQRITGTVRLSSTAVPTMTPITGVFVIDIPSSTLEISVERLDFYRRILLSSGQNDAVLAIIANAQNTLESGLISLGIVSGVQTPGT